MQQKMSLQLSASHHPRFEPKRDELMAMERGEEREAFRKEPYVITKQLMDLILSDVSHLCIVDELCRRVFFFRREEAQQLMRY